MISHERLDRLAGQVLPRRAARSFADFANSRTAADYDTVVCTTGFAREEFDRIGATNVVTVPLGVDLQTFHPRRHSALVRQQWATPTQILLVHCGRLSVEKRADRSIDALAALCDAGVDARLVVVGEGPLRARLQRQAARLPIDFTGFISDRHTVAGLLASADVTLAPGPHETFGLAALESLACGTPAVVSRTSALTEIITAGQRRLGRQRPGRPSRTRSARSSAGPNITAAAARGAAPRCSPGSGRPTACWQRWEPGPTWALPSRARSLEVRSGPSALRVGRNTAGKRTIGEAAQRVGDGSRHSPIPLADRPVRRVRRRPASLTDAAVFVPNEPVGTAVAGANQAPKRQRWIADRIGRIERCADIGNGREEFE